MASLEFAIYQLGKQKDEAAQLVWLEGMVREFLPDYKLVTNQNQNEGDDDMGEKAKGCCPEKVDALISNENTAFTEADREFLANMEEDQMEKLFVSVMANAKDEKKEEDEEEEEELENNKNKKKDDMQNNQATPAPKTAAEFISSAPPEIASLLSAGLAQLNAKKAELTTTITANSRNTFTAQQLAAMDVSQLEAIAALAEPADFSVNGGGGSGNFQTKKEEPYVNQASLFESK